MDSSQAKRRRTLQFGCEALPFLIAMKRCHLHPYKKFFQLLLAMRRCHPHSLKTRFLYIPCLLLAVLSYIIMYCIVKICMHLVVYCLEKYWASLSPCFLASAVSLFLDKLIKKNWGSYALPFFLFLPFNLF